MAPDHGLCGPIPGEVVRERLGVLLAEPRQLQVMSLSVRLVPVVLHGVVMGVELDLEAGHGDDAMDNGLAAAQFPAFLKEVMTFPAIVVDDDPHPPVVAEI